MTGPGRPALYKPENNAFARKFCLLGATNEDLAGLFDVAVRTIDNWIATIPEFAAAVRQGRDVADADVVQSLHSRATGYNYEAEKIFHYRGEVMKVPLCCPLSARHHGLHVLAAQPSPPGLAREVRAAAREGMGAPSSTSRRRWTPPVESVRWAEPGCAAIPGQE